MGGIWSSVSKAPSSGVEEADMVALCKDIWKLQDATEDLSLRRAGHKKIRADALLKLSAERKRTTGMKSEARKPTAGRE